MYTFFVPKVPPSSSLKIGRNEYVSQIVAHTANGTKAAVGTIGIADVRSSSHAVSSLVAAFVPLFVLFLA